jgi:hypothetical protein
MRFGGAFGIFQLIRMSVAQCWMFGLEFNKSDKGFWKDLSSEGRILLGSVYNRPDSVQQCFSNSVPRNLTVPQIIVRGSERNSEIVHNYFKIPQKL